MTKTVDANPFYMGADAYSGVVEAWQGYLSDVRLYSRALSAAEISAMTGLVKARKPVPANGALDVAMPLLQWTPGGTALFHNVYVGTSPDLTDADLRSAHSPMAMYYHVAGFTAGATYYWRVDEIEKDSVTVHTGDVWSFTMQDLTAYHPGPADKANDASQSPTLTWMPGQGATKHQVFFGDSLDAVTQGAAGTDKGTLALAETTFAPGALEGLTTYYWRVDEILTSGTKTGAVWSFTTSLSVDDFESYTDDLAAKTTIFDTWIDGLTNGLSGSTVGNATAPFAEQAIVHGGKQSMPLDFNNVKSPFFSEAEREFAPTADWTAEQRRHAGSLRSGNAGQQAGSALYRRGGLRQEERGGHLSGFGHRSGLEVDRVEDPAEQLRRRESGQGQEGIPSAWATRRPPAAPGVSTSTTST